MGGIGRKIGIMFFAAAAVALSCGSALAADYTMTNLGDALTPTGEHINGQNTGIWGNSINNNGDVVGQANFPNIVGKHAAYWHDGTVYDLGILTSTSNTSSAHYITDSGLIVGSAYADPKVSNIYRQAATFSVGSSPVNIHSTMSYNANNSVASSAGNGYIVGQAFNDDISIQHAVLWSNNGTTAVDMNPDWSSRSGMGTINSSGQIAGYGTPWSIGYARPTLWNPNSDGTYSADNATYLDLSTDPKYSGHIWGGISGYANDINDAGQIPVWFSNGIGGIWQNGTFTEIEDHLGFFGLDLKAINNSGVAVGNVYTSNDPAYGGNGVSHAVMYDGQTDTLIDLGTLFEGTGWYLTGAADINDNGQILVTANRRGFEWAESDPTTFILTPTQTPTPIPAAAWLLSSGLAGLGFLRRRFFLG
jgi:probable HAF family extracellular repeat protein